MKTTPVATIGSGQAAKSSVTEEMMRVAVEQAQKNGDEIIVVSSSEMDKETISKKLKEIGVTGTALVGSLDELIKRNKKEFEKTTMTIRRLSEELPPMAPVQIVSPDPNPWPSPKDSRHSFSFKNNEFNTKHNFRKR